MCRWMTWFDAIREGGARNATSLHRHRDSHARSASASRSSAAACPGARWIDPENYHLTLRFVGDIDMDVADEIADALGRVRRAELRASPRRRRLASARASRTRSSRASARRRRSPSCRPSTSAPAADRASPRAAQVHPARDARPPQGRQPAATSPTICRSAAASSPDRSGRSLRPLLVAEFGRRRALRRRGGLSASAQAPPDAGRRIHGRTTVSRRARRGAEGTARLARGRRTARRSPGPSPSPTSTRPSAS